MSEDKTVYVKPAFGLGIISVVLSILKLAGVAPIASWSWWWVTIFWWGPIGLTLAILTIIFLVVGIIASHDAKKYDIKYDLKK